MCSNLRPCTDHPMDHGLNGHRPERNMSEGPPPGTSGAGFSKKPRSRVAKRAHFKTWDLGEMRRLLKAV
ncbi:hypothetical protein Patl1_33747 [Pistacia atlantica]|uniref:Uncharacterized protein n=1 Tax=Pistacia atlantica TaxID=434234 RepID=A0ACC0ZQK5_9ROSI|nr:hypothetical protein Patl1_33747 [Pistacia atlantica]